MRRDTKQFVLFSQAGCLLPGLLLVNFVFGWIFLKPLLWITVGLVLLLMFILNLIVTARKVMSFVNTKEDSVIDVEAQVVDEGNDRARLIDREL